MADVVAFKYRAFLSYSHSDRAAGEWLHRALETYRVPEELIGRSTANGPVPKRLRPIFRDRSDLEAGHSLTEQVTEALRQSGALLVVCSPAAARSKYVNEEIRLFKAEGRAQRVFPLIVDGRPGHPERECFPPALRRQVLPDGTFGPGSEEPIAADAQAEGDGRELAKLKLAAGLLGVDIDELRKREEVEQRRRKRRWALLAALMAMLAFAAGVLAVYAFRQREKALESERQALAAKAEAERRYEQFMDKTLEFVVTVATLESVMKNLPFRILQVQTKEADNQFQEFVRSAPDPDHVWHRLAQLLVEFVQRPPRRLSGFGKELEWAEHAELILRNLKRPEYRGDLETVEREIARLRARPN